MLRIMFVDDEKLALENIRLLLPWADMGMQVTTCDNSLEALNRMIEIQPDILIADIRMPVMDGLELIARAREMYPGIKCLVLSGYGEFELAKMAIERGVQGYLLKPCARDELTQAIQKCAKELQQETAGDFDQRNQQIRQLYDALTALLAETDHTITAEQVRRITKHYGDFGILREAMLGLIMQYETAIPALRPIIRELSQFSNDEAALLGQSAAALQAISDAVDENGGMIDIVLRYVNDHYGMANLTLQYVADHVAYLNTKYLGRRFLKQTGMKFGDYLLHVRMERALVLMRKDAKMNASAIADQVGLGNNVQYFYRLFKQYTGSTFNDYRSQLKM